ncbi:hypothetical protein [Streptomyces sp. NBC_00846]|uniref:hypothetical protein n=1 Tax=Streptomyces sp. NBC_00846 TaxID=2975849 RepID=UPI003870BBC4
MRPISRTALGAATAAVLAVTGNDGSAVRSSVAKLDARDENVYSQGIPLLFPGYDLETDGLKTLPAKDGQTIGLSVTGHAGYTPGKLVAAEVSYLYDGGETRTRAITAQQGDRWTAIVNHAGAAGKPVALKTELTDANGNSVIQTVNDAYAVR